MRILQKKDKLRTVIVAHSATSRGGAEQVILETAEYLATLGAENHFVLPAEGPLADLLRDRNIPYTVISYSWWTDSESDKKGKLATDPQNRTAVCQLIDLFEQLHPVVCLTNTSVMPWGAVAAAICGIPHIWLIHELLYEGSELNLRISREDILKDIGSLSDLVVANSKATSKYLQDFISEDKIFQMYPLLHVAKIEQLAKEPTSVQYRNTNALKLAVVGRVVPEKGQLDVVRAVKALTDDKINTELMLIGEARSDYREYLEQEIREGHIEDKVVIVGHQDNPYSIIAQADVVVCASSVESFGRATAEAMVLSKPVVGTATGGTAELIEPGKTGFLYTPGHVSELVQYLKKLADRSSSKELGRTAHASILEKVDEGNKAAELYQRLSSLASTPYKPKLPTSVRLLLNIPEASVSLPASTSRSSHSSTVKRSLQRMYRKGKRYIRDNTNHREII